MTTSKTPSTGSMKRLKVEKVYVGVMSGIRTFVIPFIIMGQAYRREAGIPVFLVRQGSSGRNSVTAAMFRNITALL